MPPLTSQRSVFPDTEDQASRFVRPTPGSQLALCALYDYPAFITDRDRETLALEADHRRS